MVIYANEMAMCANVMHQFGPCRRKRKIINWHSILSNIFKTEKFQLTQLTPYLILIYT